MHRAHSNRGSNRAIGPFAIVKQVNAVTFKLDLPANMKCHPVFHVSRLKPYITGRTPAPPPPDVDEVGEELYEVECIVDHQLKDVGGRRKKDASGQPIPNLRDRYLVKWIGYPSEHNTWEPPTHLENAQEVIDEFWERRRRHVKPYAFRRVKLAGSRPGVTQ